MHYRWVDGERHRPLAFPKSGVDLGADMAAEQKEDLKQAAMRVALNMPVVQPAACFYQLDMDKFGVLWRRR